MKNLYLIGGPMGVGKTSAGQCLKKLLPNSVLLDGDWCWDADPFYVTDETKLMVLDNICHLLNNFLRCSVYENVIFCWVMHEQAVIDAILGELDLSRCRLRCVSLTAEPCALRERLSRDIESGLRDAGVIGRSLARLPLYAGLDTVKIDTTGKSAAETAAEIAALPPGGCMASEKRSRAPQLRV